MKVAKKLVALFLALVMALSLSTIAMADGNGKPVATKAPETAPTTISSVTIGGTDAEFQVDGYNNPSSPTYDESQVFIRATLPASTTEEALKSLTVVINMNGKAIVSGGTLKNVTGWSDNGATPHVYTASNVDLLNKSYTIVVGSKTYILAAGIDDSNQVIQAG